MYLGKLIDRGGNVPLVFNIERKILIEERKRSEFHTSSFNKVSTVCNGLKINIAEKSPFYISRIRIRLLKTSTFFLFLLDLREN